MTAFDPLTDEYLVAGCLKNDRRVQEQLYRKYANEMYAICLAYESDRDSAKDILQEAFIKVFKSIDQFDKRGSLKGWIRRIITNTAIDFYRRKGVEANFVDVERIADVTPSNDEELGGYGSEDILAHVKRLPEGARVIFNLFALEGYSHKEIAERLNITEGTSKSQFSRARQLLQEWVK
ncbi:MAG: RNA polymerase sigma factor [Bacteroidales bacterium]|nr:RNA polymerase sigma factor [Bacteroidales bacterium]MBN2748923.1 RNA polymerase sigma factor [Bacteroidales bacterium]